MLFNSTMLSRGFYLAFEKRSENVLFWVSSFACGPVWKTQLCSMLGPFLGSSKFQLYLQFYNNKHFTGKRSLFYPSQSSHNDYIDLLLSSKNSIPLGFSSP